MPDLLQLSSMRQKEVEHAFAGIANQYPLYTIQQCGWLRPETILDRNVRRYWELLRENISSGLNDEQAELKAAEVAVTAGIHMDLASWSKGLFYGATPQAYAQEIARRAYITSINSKIGALVKGIQTSNEQEIRRVVGEMAEEPLGGGRMLRTAEDVARQFEEVVLGGFRSIYSGTKLDEAIGGLERQTEIVLAARPSMGKSALAWQIARNVASSGKLVAFFSLEMSAVSLWQRAACPLVGVIWRDVQSGNISKEKREQLIIESRKLAKTYGDRLRIEEVPQTTETIWQSVATLQPDLVVVDHLRLLKDRHGDKEVKRLGYCSQQLREMAKAFNLSMLLVAQLNRNVEYRKEKRPTLADLRESGEIEENADVVLMMYVDSYYNPPKIPTSISESEIWVRKFRDGPRNIQVKMTFDAKQEWFDPVNDNGS